MRTTATRQKMPDRGGDENGARLIDDYKFKMGERCWEVGEGERERVVNAQKRERETAGEQGGEGG